MIQNLRQIRTLIADDDAADRNYVSSKLRGAGLIVETAVDGLDAFNKLSSFQPDVLVSDVRMPKLDGYELIRRLKEQSISVPVILLTQGGTIDEAVSAVHKLGAFWFLEKPVAIDALMTLISRAYEQTRLLDENERLRNVIRTQNVGSMVGSSPKMRHLFEVIRQAGPKKANVLITGESGTGKEMVARAIHESGPRKDAPFVALNCAALPESLIESELFGHEKGAFTGASERRLGRIELADGGTLFLDEIGELPLGMQAKLLRVLEESRFRRLGGRGEIVVDIRVLAATNRDPAQAIAEGYMREDLFYRLSVFHLELPPLRERIDEIPLLSGALMNELENKHSLSKKLLSTEVLRKLGQYHWPGNVRELRNVLERAVILAGEGEILTDHLPLVLTEEHKKTEERSTVNGRQLTLTLGMTMEEAERAIILATFEQCERNRRRTAEMLGLSLKTVQTRIKEFQTKPEDQEDLVEAEALAASA